MQPHSLHFGRAKLIRFEQIWFDLGEIWAKVIRFGQNQNLASPKTFYLLRLCFELLVL